VINILSHTYSIYVTPPGGTEQTVGSNFAFRTEQNTVTSLNWWGSLVNTSPGGTLTVCNFGVTTPSPDFSLSATPSSQAVTAGGSTSYTATVSALNGFSGSVGLSVSGLPGGATASFNPASISGSGSSTLSVATSSSTPTGTYALTITGASGSLSHLASVTLAVNPVGPGSLAIAATSESGDDGGGHTVATTIDGNFSTNWQSTTNGTSTAFAQYDLGANHTVSSVKIAWYLGNTRSTWFDVLTSTDGSNWTAVVNGANSSGTTTAYEAYSFGAVSARYVRYVCHGTSIDNVNAIAETQIIGQ